MTVSTIGSVAEFATNGVTTNFPFYFKFLENEDLVVTYVDPDGASSILALGTQYTVSGAGNDTGGSVVTSSALAGPGQLVVSREMDPYQLTSLRNQGKFLAETHEDVFDRLTMLIQQGFSILKRVLTRPLGKDYFYAEDRRISNVADPVEQQDAATKHWSLSTIAAQIAASTGNFNLASNVFYQGPDTLPYTVQDMSDWVSLQKGSSLIATRQALDGSARRTLREKNSDLVSLKDFDGVVGDGVHDDGAGLQAALDSGRPLTADDSVYYCNRNLVIKDKDFFLSSLGRAEIRFGPLATVGFTGTFSKSITTVMVENVLITTTRVALGTGMKLTWPENFDHGFTSRLLMMNVTFRGADDYNNGWSTCLEVVQADNASFIGVCFKGIGGDPSNFTQAANTRTLIGCALRGRYSPTDFHFTNCWFYCVYTGLDVGDTAEGVILTSCTMVEVRNGVQWFTGFWSPTYPSNPGGNASGRPQLVLTGCHINCFQRAVYTSGVVSIKMSQNLCYHIDRATQVGNLVEIINSTEASVRDNEFWGFNSNFPCNGVVFGSNVTYSDCMDNIFVSNGVGAGPGMTTGIALLSGANDNTIRGNRSRGTFGFVMISDSGLRNTIGRRGVSLVKTAAQSMTSGAGTLVSFDAATYQTEGTWWTGGGNITIPPGVFKIKISCGVSIDSNGTGVRQIEIRKNNAIAGGFPIDIRAAAPSGSSTAFTLSSGILSVGGGDVLTMVALQNSGGALNMQGSSLTWISIEVVE